jgi:hypothetical protein
MDFSWRVFPDDAFATEEQGFGSVPAGYGVQSVAVMVQYFVVDQLVVTVIDKKLYPI